ncbi:MAG: V-type ATP synthase subunit D [Johnsonella sp.]|nr:V-type ATP synthase subunit D [Johnsonella sp.]
MNTNAFPTKGNYIAAKNSLSLAKQGYGLMDKKRNILFRELMNLIDQAKEVQTEIDSTFTMAYAALQKANIELGIEYVKDIADSLPVENSVRIKSRSVMGTDIPLVEYQKDAPSPPYSYYANRESLDIARMHFTKVKDLCIRLAMIENSAYRLASNIKKTQKRANALKNITIPHYEMLIQNIGSALEEKEREEFTRLKVIKKQKQST